MILTENFEFSNKQTKQFRQHSHGREVRRAVRVHEDESRKSRVGGNQHQHRRNLFGAL